MVKTVSNEKSANGVKRRDFLRMAGMGLSVCAFSVSVRGYEPLPALKIRRIDLTVGAERPFRIMHISDSHIARIDSRDGDSVYAFAKVRSRIGRELGEYYLSEAVHYARMAEIKLVHTGDFMDFMSEANLEYAARRLRTDDFVACVGNHEYWLDAGKIEVEAYKAPTVHRLRPVWDGVPASVTRINGVSFFMFDNAFRTVTAEIAAQFEEVVKDGLPIVMVCHVPLWVDGCGLRANVCGCPGRTDCDAISCAFVERVRREPLVKAVLAGHLHSRRDFRFSPYATECVANALFNGEAAEVSIS